MNRKGVTLIELIVAMAILAIAAPLLSQSFYQGSKFVQKIKSTFNENRSMMRAAVWIEKDLKNSVHFRSEVFHGENHKLSFVSLGAGLEKISYSLSDGVLIRRQESVVANSHESVVDETILSDDIVSFDVEYAHEDKNGNLIFLPYWKDAPYQGIPRGIKIGLTMNPERPIERQLFIFLPQGRLAYVA